MSTVPVTNQNQPTGHANPSHELLDDTLQRLHQQRDQWTNLSTSRRVGLLQECLVCLQGAADDWVRSGQEAKGIRSDSPAAGEEWLAGPYLVARNMRLLARSLQEIERFGRPRLPGKAHVKHGRTIAPVFPTDLYDRIMFTGYRAEVWMQPHVTVESLPESMALAYHGPARTGKVCAVLGAGNVSSIGPMDALYKLFVDNSVVCLKLHPQNEYLKSAWHRSLEPIIKIGALAIVHGGADEGRYLVQHPLVDEVHLTGSSATYDAIVYGDGPEGTERKRRGEPLSKKKVTSELGNVSAMIVVPGRWSESDISRQAENVASSLVNNAGFNCNATRIIVTHRSWQQRDDFLNAVRSFLSGVSPRPAYYHGAVERYQRFMTRYPAMERFGTTQGAGDLAWGLIADLDAQDANQPSFRDEPFCGLMSEAYLDADSVPTYIEKAVQLVNDRLFGSLNASILVSPESTRNPEVDSALSQAIADLRVGTVAINHWAALGYALCSTTWGAYPGHSPQDIQSGQGVVHNTYMFSAVEKSVVYGPFRPWPKPVWFATHRRSKELGKRLVDFECRPSVFKLPQIFRHACEL